MMVVVGRRLGIGMGEEERQSAVVVALEPGISARSEFLAAVEAETPEKSFGNARSVPLRSSSPRGKPGVRTPGFPRFAVGAARQL